MEPRTARRALVAAMIAGIAADLLFDRLALGVNVTVATAAVLAVLTWLGDRRMPDRLDLWLPFVAVTASLGPALRTDPSIVPLDLCLVVASVAACGFAVRGVAVTRGTATEIAALGARALVAVATGFVALVAKAAADGFFSRRTARFVRLAPVVRGAVIAVPIVVGFGLLLASADAVFGRAVDEVLHLPVDIGDVLGRGAFSIAAAILVAGPISIAAGAALGRAGRAEAAPGERAARDDAGRARSGATETLIVLLGVDALFAAFAIVQVIYLFGGADTLSAIGMTHSEYARQGYFQLVGVVALAGLLLLGAHEVMGRTRAFVIAALALTVLTGIILGSAAVRLRLYQEAYGWTELRFFVAASIAWLAACVAVALAGLAWGRMRWLPHGIALSAVAITLAVSAIGPQAFVMRQNLARVLDPGLVPPDGRSGFDADYGITLGDDTVPDLVAALAYLPPRERSVVLSELERRRATLARDDASAAWPAWNLSRERARAALSRLPQR